MEIISWGVWSLKREVTIWLIKYIVAKIQSLQNLVGKLGWKSKVRAAFKRYWCLRLTTLFCCDVGHNYVGEEYQSIWIRIVLNLRKT